MAKTMKDVLESAPAASTPNKKAVQEAARLFNQALNGGPTHKAMLQEAFSTSDFPTLLGSAFEIQARAAYRSVSDETTAITTRHGVSDFRVQRLRDIFGETYFEDVAEGEEYKADNPFAETQIEFRVGKTGRVYPITWELFLSGDFSSLADFPGLLGRGAANTRNRKVYENLVNGEPGAGELNTEFFSETSGLSLSHTNLRAALDHLSHAENHRGDDLVDSTNAVLVVPPTLERTAQEIVGVSTIRETTTEGDTEIQRELSNPLAGVTVQASREFGRLLSPELRTSAWALLPNGSSENPALVHAYLNGHPDVDLRVQNNQGNRIGGGEVGFEEGSFDNDTLAYRGRYVIGAAPAFTQGTFASTGQG